MAIVASRSAGCRRWLGLAERQVMLPMLPIMPSMRLRAITLALCTAALVAARVRVRLGGVDHRHHQRGRHRGDVDHGDAQRILSGHPCRLGVGVPIRDHHVVWPLHGAPDRAARLSRRLGPDHGPDPRDHLSLSSGRLPGDDDRFALQPQRRQELHDPDHVGRQRRRRARSRPATEPRRCAAARCWSTRARLPSHCAARGSRARSAAAC